MLIAPLLERAVSLRSRRNSLPQALDRANRSLTASEAAAGGATDGDGGSSAAPAGGGPAGGCGATGGGRGIPLPLGKLATRSFGAGAGDDGAGCAFLAPDPDGGSPGAEAAERALIEMLAAVWAGEEDEG